MNAFGQGGNTPSMEGIIIIEEEEVPFPSSETQQSQTEEKAIHTGNEELENHMKIDIDSWLAGIEGNAPRDTGIEKQNTHENPKEEDVLGKEKEEYNFFDFLSEETKDDEKKENGDNVQNQFQVGDAMGLRSTTESENIFSIFEERETKEEETQTTSIETLEEWDASKELQETDIHDTKENTQQEANEFFDPLGGNRYISKNLQEHTSFDVEDVIHEREKAMNDCILRLKDTAQKVLTSKSALENKKETYTLQFENLKKELEAIQKKMEESRKVLFQSLQEIQKLEAEYKETMETIAMLENAMRKSKR